MLYDVKTPKEYFDALEEDWRKEVVLGIRKMILSHSTTLQEGIWYKMLSYGNDISTLFHLNAQKAYVSLYIGDIDKVENGRRLLQGLDLGKGCIRIKKSTAIQETNLEQFIINSIKAWERGEDMEC